MIDHHVDRPDVHGRQRPQLTGPNRPSGSIIPKHHAWKSSPDGTRPQHHRPAITGQCSGCTYTRNTSQNRIHPSPVMGHHPDQRTMDWTTWWLWRGAYTRSHPELGREMPQRPWYCVSRHGRVGRRQVFQCMQITPQTNHPRGVEQPGSSSGS